MKIVVLILSAIALTVYVALVLVGSSLCEIYQWETYSSPFPGYTVSTHASECNGPDYPNLQISIVDTTDSKTAEKGLYPINQGEGNLAAMRYINEDQIEYQSNGDPYPPWHKIIWLDSKKLKIQYLANTSIDIKLTKYKDVSIEYELVQ